ncbi:MAG TPA: hypothetical protein VK191_13950 [Symbiobacteriaceae bacterium]|nr:hypothetical protein [Symbiobacteriaceae bacterium]
MNDLLLTLGHVKWFTNSTESRPEALANVLTPTFLAGAFLTLAVAILLTLLNRPLQELGWVQRIHAALDRLRVWSPWLLRIGMVAPLIGAALGGYLFHYELGPVPLWIRLAQALLAIMLLLPRADRFAALGILGLYSVGVATFGLHHMLDYLFWVGAASYLAIRSTKIEGAGIPLLYIATGVALAWAAIEKWVFPGLALDILAHNPIPTFGFPAATFLMLSGWIELGVGYLMMTGVLNRLLSIVVTLLFILTSSVFGVHEILGHWLVHAALLVFLIEGTGRYVTPVLWHRSVRLQVAFVGVTLAPFVAGLMWLYYVL